MSFWLYNIYVNCIIPWASNYIPNRFHTQIKWQFCIVRWKYMSTIHIDIVTFWVCFSSGSSGLYWLHLREASLFRKESFIPIGSMYGIFTHVWYIHHPREFSCPVSFRRCNVLLPHQRSGAPLRRRWFSVSGRVPLMETTWSTKAKRYQNLVGSPSCAFFDLSMIYIFTIFSLRKKSWFKEQALPFWDGEISRAAFYFRGLINNSSIRHLN